MKLVSNNYINRDIVENETVLKNCYAIDDTNAINDTTNERMFQFSCVSVDDSFKKVKKLSTCKATQSNAIPINILEQNPDNFSEYICNVFNFCVNEGKFWKHFKQVNITPPFTKDYRSSIQGELLYWEYLICHC